eukprot:COSAG05_NODE_22366_length_265_cov_0.626506_1_plen_39_part_10
MVVGGCKAVLGKYTVAVLNVGGQFFHVLIGLPTNFGGRL